MVSKKQWEFFARGGTSGFILALLTALAVTAYADVRQAIRYPGSPTDVSFFIHISDPHIGSGPVAAQNFEDFLAYMDSGQIHPVCIVNTGDLTEGGVCFPDYGFCIPTGPDKKEWEAYYEILNRYPDVMEIYYDLPGNHDRYGQAGHWTGQTGYDGYAYFGVRGSASPFESNTKSQVDLEGQYGWENSSAFFMAVNTCDETGISFFEYETINYTDDPDLIFPLGGSDLPVLSEPELDNLLEGLGSFSSKNNSTPRFIFGHHPIESERGYDPGGFTDGIFMPGLYDEKGYVLNYLSEPIQNGADRLQLLDAGTFPDSKGEPVTAWIETFSVPGSIPEEVYWQGFTYAGKDTAANELTGCRGIEKGSPAGQRVIGHRPDRGAGELIDLMDTYQVSAYLYGHTHTVFDAVRMVQIPGNEKRVLAMNTGALKNGVFRIVSVDNNGISTRVARIDAQGEWPIILITAPVDKYLADGELNPYDKPILNSQDMVVRAFAFAQNEADPKLEFQVLGKDVQSGWNPMVRIQAVENLYQGIWDCAHLNLSPGEYAIEVREKNQMTGRLRSVQVIQTDQPDKNYPPDGVTLVSPSQKIMEPMPSFVWESEASASWYRLYVWDDAKNKVFARWYEASAICSDQYCRVNPELQLPDNKFEWFVKSWNEYGSKWSGGLPFVIATLKLLPSKISLNSPAGAISEGSSEFIWNLDPAASWYKIKITRTDKTIEYAQWYEIRDMDSQYPEAVCSGDICSITIDGPFLEGSYKWQVKGWNETGPGDWSEQMTFCVVK